MYGLFRGLKMSPNFCDSDINRVLSGHFSALSVTESSLYVAILSDGLLHFWANRKNMGSASFISGRCDEFWTIACEWHWYLSFLGQST